MLAHFRFCTVIAVLAVWSAPAFAQAQCPLPKTMAFQIERKISRDVTGFTQGLEFHNGRLYESTGLINGSTRLNAITTAGKVTRLKDFGQSFFGEGLTIFGGQIFQLSWNEHLVHVYDLKGKFIRRMNNPREGWGLTHDAKNLIFSDGTDQIFYVDPKTFAVTRTLSVQQGFQPLPSLNELEYVNGKIYANVFQTNLIVRISADTGCVEAQAELDHLTNRMTDAELRHIYSDINYLLNGIAYDAAKKLFYVTGKSWPAIFTGRFVDQ